MRFVHATFAQPSSQLLALAVHFGRCLTSISAMGLTLVQALLFGLESYFMCLLTTFAIVIHVLIRWEMIGWACLNKALNSFFG